MSITEHKDSFYLLDESFVASVLRNLRSNWSVKKNNLQFSVKMLYCPNEVEHSKILLVDEACWSLTQLTHLITYLNTDTLIVCKRS